MLQALVAGGTSMFYGTPSQCLLEDSLGRVHTITQDGRRGAGDAMMPLLSPWVITQRGRECSGRVLFAFLDDVHTVSMPIACGLWAESGPASSGSCRSCSSGVAGIRGFAITSSRHQSVRHTSWPPGDAQRTSSHIVGPHSHGRGCAVGVVASGSLCFRHVARVVEPQMAATFCQRHDARVWECLCRILHTSPEQGDDVVGAASMLFVLGGIEL